MAKVVLGKYENFNGLLKRFKKSCDEERIVLDSIERRFFEKQSAVKRKSLKKSARREAKLKQDEKDLFIKKY